MSEKKEEIQLTATHLDALMLPPGFSRAYQMYLINQRNDMGTLQDKSNTAGRDANQALAENIEQDKKINSLESQVASLTEKCAATAEKLNSLEDTLRANGVIT